MYFSWKAVPGLAELIIVIPKFNLHKNPPYMQFYLNILAPKRYHAFIYYLLSHFNHYKNPIDRLLNLLLKHFTNKDTEIWGG